MSNQQHGTRIGSFIHRVAAKGLFLTTIDDALHTIFAHRGKGDAQGLTR